MKNRKLKRNVVFDQQETYNGYQCPIIEWLMKHFSINENQAALLYIQSGLAEAFKKKHKPQNKPNEIKVSKMKQVIGE